MKQFTLAFALVFALGLSVGCESTETADDGIITADDVLADMSPMLDHRSRTHDEARITHARTFDTNGRSMWTDIERIFLLDRPSRQSLFPTP